jgi:lysophospholipase L1-like esterase
LLGDKYEVRNFGVSGATLLSKGDLPYVKQKAFEEARAFKPNIVVINLGANDTKPQNWKYEDEYLGDYQKLIGAFTDLESKPQVYVCTPVPAYPGNFGITNEKIEKGVKPKVEQLAKDGKAKLIDLYAALSEKANLFPDKVHPNADGARLIAEAVYKAIGAK